MKNMIRTISILLVLVLAVTAATVPAAAWTPYKDIEENPNDIRPITDYYSEGDFTFEVGSGSEGPICNVFYQGDDTEIVIPEYYTLYGTNKAPVELIT